MLFARLRFAVAGVPPADVLVLAHGNNCFAVGAESDAGDLLAVPAERKAVLTVGGIEQDHVVVIGHGEGRAVGTESSGELSGLGAAADDLAGLRIPETQLGTAI